jgi:hypothetical protein
MKDLELDHAYKSLVHELIKELNSYIMCVLTHNHDPKVISHMHANIILIGVLNVVWKH